MRYLFLSPHLDDVILSCGGIIHRLSSTGDSVMILTIFAGNPPSTIYSDFARSLQLRWGLPENPMPCRRKEDKTACAIIGATPIHLPIPDCIYRIKPDNEYLVTKEEDLFQEIGSSQDDVVQQVTQRIQEQLISSDILVSPFAIGDHIDHRIVRKAATTLHHESFYLFAVYPYTTIENSSILGQLPADAMEMQYSISTIDITFWKQSIAAYQSQISTFWNSEYQMMEKLDLYAAKGGGKSLWLAKKIS